MSANLFQAHASARGSLESKMERNASNCWRRFSIAINQDIAKLATAVINDDGEAPEYDLAANAPTATSAARLPASPISGTW